MGTPPDEDGSADLKYVLQVARTIGQHLNKYLVVVTKSTVPVGTASKIRNAINEELAKRGANVEFDVASNPEFLKEGSAIKDFMSPDRVVIGVDSDRAKAILTRTRSSFLFVSDLVVELVGADVNMVRAGIGSDNRIGRKFLYAGCGYGGSCFPKDVKALVKTASDCGYPMEVLQAVESVNERQKSILFRKLQRVFGDEPLAGKTITLWGLAFKPETDDMREAPALVMIDLLKKAGCKVRAYDPIAMDECKRRVGDAVTYCDNMYDALDGTEALLLLTEWKQFRLPDWNEAKRRMKRHLVIDGRNIFDAAEMTGYGFEYHCIGR